MNYLLGHARPSSSRRLVRNEAIDKDQMNEDDATMWWRVNGEMRKRLERRLRKRDEEIQKSVIFIL